MQIIDRPTARVLTTVILFTVIGVLLYAGRKTLFIFLFAIFFAYLLEPLVKLLQRWNRITRGSRTRSIAVVYLLLILFIGLLGYLVGPTLVEEGKNLGQTLPSLLDRLSSGQLAGQLAAERGWSRATQIQAQRFLAGHRDTIMAWAAEFGRRAAELATNIIWLVVIPILAVFFLKDGRRFTEVGIEYFESGSDRQFLRGIAEDLDQMLASYIRAQLTLAALSGVVYVITLSLLNVPYAVVLGVFGGILEFVPVAGPFVAAVSIVGVAFLTSYQHVLAVVAFLAIWRLVQDYVTAPRVMSGKLELHPVASLFAILLGGEIGGVLGVYLSVPVMATLRIFWRQWHRYKQIRPLSVVNSIPRDPGFF